MKVEKDREEGFIEMRRGLVEKGEENGQMSNQECGDKKKQWWGYVQYYSLQRNQRTLQHALVRLFHS